MLKIFLAAVLLSASVERFGVSRMRHFFLLRVDNFTVNDRNYLVTEYKKSKTKFFLALLFLMLRFCGFESKIPFKTQCKRKLRQNIRARIKLKSVISDFHGY